MRDYYKRQAEDLARFRKDTADHRMQVIHEEEMFFRHIRVQRPGSSNYLFNITTTPGYLIVTGDMGSYTFSRLPDMFQFHRINWDKEVPTIDYSYWASKCEAVAKNGGLEEFDEDSFKREAVRAFRESNVSVKEFKDFRDVVLSAGYSNSDEATRAVMDWFYYDRDDYNRVYPFQEFYEFGPFNKPSFRFRWICWAIACTINDYDRGGDRVTRQQVSDKKTLKSIHVV